MTRSRSLFEGPHAGGEYLAAVLRGDGAEQVSPEAQRQVQVPVLVLNGKDDLANQQVARLVSAFPNARSAVCDGDHHSTPWHPSFQQAVASFFVEQWRIRTLGK